MIGKRRFLFCLFFLAVLFSFNVGAVSFGVSPAIYEVDFEPGLEKDFVFNFATDAPDLDFVVNVTGELAHFVTLDKYKYSGKIGTVTATLKLPQSIDVPGSHRIFVGALPKTDNRGRTGGAAAVGITVRANGVIKVLVPYPGKYADVVFNINDANAGEKVKYRLRIYSRGEEQIVTSTSINVYDSTNKSVGVFDIGSDIIPSSEHVEINSDLDVSTLEAGNYRAVAVVTYSGGERRAEDTFRLGNLSVDIVNYTREFDRNKINQIYIDVKSGWNDPIKGVYATGKVVGHEEVTFQTSSVDLGPWKEAKLIGHFDTTPIGEEENFQMELVLHYGDKTVEETINLKLKEEKFNYLLWGGIGFGILIIVGYIVWLIVKLKKLERKSGKRKRKK
jgi:hypothetical protein